MVDALTYRIQKARTAASVGDINFLGEKAKGVFIVITLHVRSSRKETGTLNEDMFKLETGGCGAVFNRRLHKPAYSDTWEAAGTSQYNAFISTDEAVQQLDFNGPEDEISCDDVRVD